ncbi:MAG: putative rane protein [Alphaproteobacteria bacterium]|nr:putative rane protein [Alphaproteobacteria bacterium]
MTDAKLAIARPAGLRHWLALLRELVVCHPAIFMAIWAAGLLVLAPLSLLPGTAPPVGVWDVDLSFDKVLHVIAYGGLTGIPMLALTRRDWLSAAVAVVLIAAFGYEIGQSFVPGRSFGYDDLIANLGGVALGVVLGVWIRRLPAAR